MCGVRSMDADHTIQGIEDAMTLTGAQRDDSHDLHGQVTGIDGGILRGWVSETPLLMMLSCDVDGEIIARGVPGALIEEADGEAAMRSYQIVLPMELYDGVARSARVTAHFRDGAKASGTAFDMILKPEDCPRPVAVLTPPAEGRLRGKVSHPFDPDCAVPLELYVNGRSALQVESWPDQGGRFEFDVTQLASFDLSCDRIDIVENLSGASLSGVLPDMLQSAAQVRLVEEESGAIGLVLRTPLSNVHISAAHLCGADGAALQSLNFEPTDDRYEVVAYLPQRPEQAVTLALGDTHLPVDQHDDDAEHPPGTRLGVGSFVPVSKIDRLEDALAATLGENYFATSPASYPDFTGAWGVTPAGTVEGWILDLSQPEHPFSVDIKVNGSLVGTVEADQMTWLSGTRAVGHWPFGFRFDLSSLELPDGFAIVAVCPSGGDQDIAAFEARNTIAFPVVPTTRTLSDFVLPSQVPSEYDVRGDAIVPATPDVVDGITTAFLARAGLGWTGTVGAVLLQACDRLMQDEEAWAALADPSSPLPHHKLQPPLLGVDMSEMIAALPLPEARKDALQICSNWREFLRLLLDPEMFAGLLDVRDIDNVLKLQKLRDLAGGAAAEAELSIDWARGGRKVVHLPEVIEAAEHIVIGTAQDTVLLDAPVSTRETPHRILSRLSRILEETSAEPDLLIALQTAGTWRLHPLQWHQRVTPDPIDVDPGCVVQSMTLSGVFCEVTCDGVTLVESLFLNVAGAVHELKALPVEDEAENGPRQFLCKLREPLSDEVELAEIAGSAGTYDLRLRSPSGARPDKLPLSLAPTPEGRMEFFDLLIEGGSLHGLSFTTEQVGRKLPVQLVEILPEALPEEEAEHPLQVVNVVPGRPGNPKSFRLPLPPSVLDGAVHRLKLVVTVDHAQAPEILWEQDFQATSEVLAAQLEAIEDAEGCARFLMRLAQVGQFEFLEHFFSAPRKDGKRDISIKAVFEILATAILHSQDGQLPAGLTRMFESLWTFSSTGAGRRQAFGEIARRVLSRAHPDVPLARFPQAPTGEAIVDLIFAAQPEKPGEYADLIRTAMMTRRYPLAKALLQKGLTAHPGNPVLLVLQAHLALQHGDVAGAEVAARAALKAESRFSGALMTLARCLSLSGRQLEAMAVLTGGKGLSSWVEKVPNYEFVKLTSGLDWDGVKLRVAQAEGRDSLEKDVLQSRQALGAPVSLSDTPYSVFFLKDNEKAASNWEIFQTLRAQTQCCQVAVPDSTRPADLECMGNWAFVFDKKRAVRPDFLQMIMDQKRSFEPVVHFVSCDMEPTGEAGAFRTVGMLARADVLRAFGGCSLEDFVTQAHQSLKVKSILI